MSYERPQDYPRYSGAPDPELTRYVLQPGYPDQLPAYGVLRDNSDATVSLVLGLVGLCTFLLLASPFAWWIGSRALRQIDANPGIYGNRGMAVGGQITGIIGTALLSLSIVAGLFVLFIFGIAASSN